MYGRKEEESSNQSMLTLHTADEKKNKIHSLDPLEYLPLFLTSKQ